MRITRGLSQSVASLDLPPCSGGGSADFMRVGVIVVVMVNLGQPYSLAPSTQAYRRIYYEWADMV